MKRSVIILSLVLVMPFSAWAEDIVATWQHKGNNTMTLSMRDTERIRMDTGADNYMLVSGEKVYMVTGQDGKWTVMDMDQLAGMMSRFGAQPGAASQDGDQYQSTFKNTGRTETIAGYKGSVYLAETKDGSGKVIDSSEVVFSKNKDVERASRAWMTLAMRMGNIIGKDTSVAVDRATKQAEMSGYGGMLRIDEMTLVSIEKPSLSAAYYELPKDAEKMDMGSLPGGEAGTAGTGSSGDDSNFAKDLGKEAGDAAQDEVKQNTIEEVRKGIGGLFKKVF